MNRIDEIDYFIKYYANIYIQNPNLAIESDTLYNGLSNYGIPSNEIRANIKNNFEDWENYFENKKLHVYQDMRQTRFLQFRKMSGVTGEYDCAKLYLTFPKDKINYCVKKVFDFIDKNNMPTCSKVADTLRADSVILRMVKLEDAKKVMDFINSSDLSMYANLTNPFLMRNGKVGMACDNLLSYNTVVSTLLKKYFEQCRNNNKLNIASVQDFTQFVKNYGVDIFNNMSKIDDLSLEYGFASNRHRFENFGQFAMNHQQIFDLILISLDPKSTEKDYYEHVSNCNNFEDVKKYVDYYNDIYINKHSFVQENFKLAEQTLNDYIKYAKENYGQSMVSQYLYKYMEGNSSVITRTNNFRNKFQNYITPNIIISIMGQDLNAYINNIEQRNVNNGKISNNEKLNLCTNIFNSYVTYAINKYGIQNAMSYIYLYLSGNINGITRDNNFRTLFEQNLTPEIINFITSGNVEDYYYNIYNSMYSSNIERKYDM